MKAPAITLFALTILLALGGIKVASDGDGGLFKWVGAMLPAAALLYLAIRVWNDKPQT
jgi:hypothetical protein